MRIITPEQLKELFRKHDGNNEIVVNDTIHFGIRYYAYKEDVIAAHIPTEDYTTSPNSLFLHLNADGMDKLIDYIFTRDGYLATNEDEETLSSIIKLNFKKFLLVDGEMDCKIYQRSFSGRMTPARRSLLQRICETFTYSEDHCGHEHDCCGCMIAQSLEMKHKQNLTTFTLTRTYNY